MARQKVAKKSSARGRLAGLYASLSLRRARFLERRPHRSFRRTTRRDAVRKTGLPGYVSFTKVVVEQFLRHKRQLFGLVAVYGVSSVVFLGLASQASYAQLSTIIDETSGDLFSGGVGQLGQIGVLFASSVSGLISPEMTEAQQFLSVLFVVLAWLTTIWLLRGFYSGAQPTLREGLYNAAAPLVPMTILSIILLLQLVPAAVGVIVIGASFATDLGSNGFIAMTASLAGMVLILLSVYWIVSTMVALILITLPGMGPLKSLRLAGDIVIGRRLPFMLRMVWLLLTNVVIWIVLVIPLIVIDQLLLSQFELTQSLPLVPLGVTTASSIVVVWSAAYMYVLYRKVVEYDA